MDQSCSDGGVNPAGQAKDDLFATDLLTDARDRILNDLARRPQPAAGTDLPHKGIDQQFTTRGVVNFRVKLNPIKVSCNILNRADRGIIGAGDGFKTLRHGFDMVTMTHPDRRVIFYKKVIE